MLFLSMWDSGTLVSEGFISPVISAFWRNLHTTLLGLACGGGNEGSLKDYLSLSLTL